MTPRRTVVATAFTFLTRLPLSRFASGDPEVMARATLLFPVVGLVIGSIVGLVFIGAEALMPLPLAVLATLVVGILLTGGFHEDGLADVADSTGAFGREAKLEIMRDSRIGTYGALALILLIVARLLLLSELGWSSWGVVLGALIAAHALARWSSVALMAWLPYARAEAANKTIAQGVTASGAVIASGFALGSVLIAALMGGPLLLVSVPVAMVAALLAGWWFKNSFGGITGDCLGATNVVVEVAVLSSVVILSAHV